MNKLSRTIHVPETYCFDTADQSMDKVPEDPVSCLVSRYAYDLAVRALKKHQCSLIGSCLHCTTLKELGEFTPKALLVDDECQ